MARTSSAFLVLAMLVVGCSKADNRKPVFPVSGKVSFNGEPMDGAMISFHPLNDPSPRALRAQATADKAGQFSLTTYVTGDGAPAGEYAVTIYWPARKQPRPKGTDPTAEDDDIPPDRLHRVHADPKTTKLRATVHEQSNTIDFTLP